MEVAGLGLVAEREDQRLVVLFGEMDADVPAAVPDHAGDEQQHHVVKFVRSAQSPLGQARGDVGDSLNGTGTLSVAYGPAVTRPGATLKTLSRCARWVGDPSLTPVASDRV